MALIVMPGGLISSVVGWFSSWCALSRAVMASRKQVRSTPPFYPTTRVNRVGGGGAYNRCRDVQSPERDWFARYAGAVYLVSHPLDPPAIQRNEFLARQERARVAAASAGYDAVLAIGRSFYDRPGDLAWLANHLPPFPTAVFSDELRGLGHAFFLLPVHGPTTLVTDPRRWRSDLIVADDARSANDLAMAITDVIRSSGLANARIAIAGDDLLPAPFDRQMRSDLPDVTFLPDHAVLGRLRAIKSPAEQALMRRAAACADSAITASVETIRRGRATERDVCAEAIAAAMRDGADFVRYFRVHSGPWSATGSRWPQAMDRQIEPGEVVVVDAIGAFQGYQFDVNRTIGTSALEQRERDLCETALEATAAAVRAALPGNLVGDIARAARAVVNAGPFIEGLGDMMGHGIGLETVELPYITEWDETVLEPGMCFCIEPGLFYPGWIGAAIEQEVIIQPAGAPEIITDTPMRIW
jgi:Xaa-Pro aminopeptidase